MFEIEIDPSENIFYTFAKLTMVKILVVVDFVMCAICVSRYI